MFNGNEPSRWKLIPDRPSGSEPIGTFRVIEHDGQYCESTQRLDVPAETPQGCKLMRGTFVNAHFTRLDPGVLMLVNAQETPGYSATH